MSRLTFSRGQVLCAAVATYVVVFVLRLVSDDPSNGVAFLYVLPIIMVATEFGAGAAMVAAGFALGLLAVWNVIDEVGITLVGFGVRALVFVLVGALCAQMADRLRRTTEASDRYFELGGDMLCTANLDGYFTRLNGRWTEILGWSREELMSKRFLEFVHPDDRERTEQEASQISQQGEPTVSFTNRLATKAGGWRIIEWSSKLDTAHGLIYAAARDATERHEIETAQAAAEERFRAAFEDSATGMAVVGLRGGEAGRILEANDRLAEVVGVPREELLGISSLSEFAHPDDHDALAERMRRLSDEDLDLLRMEIRIQRPDGETRWVDLTTSMLRDPDGVPAYRLSQLIDIDERKRTEQALRHMADHDPLSWLFNHRRFMVDLEEEVASTAMRGSRGAVLLIDLDKFKQVNDVAGHAVGDEVIKTVGLALVRRLRTGDLAARLGGDEFAVLLRRVDAEQAILVAHDLRAVVADALCHLSTEQARAVTLSIGVAMIDRGAPQLAADVLALADAAMYSAKASGGDAVELQLTSPPVPLAR